MFLFRQLVTEILLPPTSLLLLVLLGVWMMRNRHRRMQEGGFLLAILSVVSLLLLNTPSVSRALITPLEPYPPDQFSAIAAGTGYRHSGGRNLLRGT